MKPASSALSPEEDLTVARELFARVAADLSMIVDHPFVIREVRCERLHSRPAGEGSVHLSFQLAFDAPGSTRQGCLLVPFADAVRLAGYLIMLADEELERRIASGTLEEDLKSGMLELLSFVANAAEVALRDVLPRGSALRPLGCQGVRAGVRPKLDYREGEELLVLRARASVHEASECELVFLLPAAALAAQA